ncbi:BMP family ABC transporter substrate-binding protein (plasmid) [Paroceanicella profunda]|uniref:BMP family ABC transporter substrate-binding protein n=1 Tax=Paroceanicella profunda TaxID=2579971 RepID=A0A5B8FYZ7_9RHOB|nr:BMP family ABC transporter substrate-binding protein [Paroceanicella profunda]QDL94136.1 BMP family ABC transporter substrate-binding protein [Paroceanicella profunda]
MKLAATVLAAAAALALGASGVLAQAKDHVKVGFVYVGPVGDFGWSYQHDVARKAVEEKFGDKVETTFVESVPEGPDAERVIQQMARSGTDLIFTTSFGYMDQTVKVAKMFPNVKFEHATGYKRADNVSTYSSRFYEGRHVIGLIAGKMTKTNTIGYIASFPIPEVVRGINAAYLAAKSVNPDVKFKIVWVSTWFDPAKEADAAKALIEQGADIIMQHTDSPAAMTIAQENGILAFGQASDMKQFGPDAQLTSIMDHWDPYYISRVQAVLDGTWESTDTWGGFDTGMVQLAEFSDKIPEDVKKLAMDARDAIAAGTLHPFTGPINKQDGSPWLAEGEVADDGTLLGMNFYVEGIEGDLPK